MAEDNRNLSPPLPPDPTQPPLSQTTSKEPVLEPVPEPEPLATPEMTAFMPHQPPQPDLKRHDSMRPQPQLRVPQVQPIKDAVNDAFEHSPANSQVDPDLIKIVTEQVIKNLQAAGATPTTAAQPPPEQYYPPPPPPQMPRSPTEDSSDSMPRRYTPPTPERYQAQRGSGASSPERVPSDAGSSFSRESVESMRSSESRRSGNTPRPFNAESPNKGRRTSTATAFRRASGPDDTSRERTAFRRDSRDSEASYDGAPRSRPRPPRVPSDVAETTLEKIWGPLFDNGNPTMRLSQFLRGLALHLIDDYEPKHSLVVTPQKMLRFFREASVENEHYPWGIIFGGKMSCASISTMYRKLLCQHHLVQLQNHEQPSIPALTPLGFDWFMTCLIQAHPDTECERLAKAVMNMPISNADTKAERFPKELSRRLLPAQPNLQAEQRLTASLNHEPQVIPHLKGLTAMPPPPASAPPPPQGNSSFSERERQPYSHAQSSNAIDDDDLGGPSLPIERERKPYTAREGEGKRYESEDGRPPTQQFKPDVTDTRSRTNSGIPPQGMYNNTSGSSDPMNIPPRNAHRMSMGQGAPPTLNGGYPKPGRGRSSPPPRNPYARSEPFEVGSMPAAHFGSNLHPTQPNQAYPQVDFEEADRMRRYQSRSRTDRSNTTNSNPPNEDDGSSGRGGYPIPMRNNVPINNGYEYGGVSSGGPPVGSFPSRRPATGLGNDDRRRSMYGSPNTGSGLGGGGIDGGTDGYGSFAGQMNGGNGNGYPQQPYGSSQQH